MSAPSGVTKGRSSNQPLSFCPSPSTRRSISGQSLNKREPVTQEPPEEASEILSSFRGNCSTNQRGLSYRMQPAEDLPFLLLLQFCFERQAHASKTPRTMQPSILHRESQRQLSGRGRCMSRGCSPVESHHQSNPSKRLVVWFSP